MGISIRFAFTACVCALFIAALAPVRAETPQSVSDIAAVLEHEKPDPQRIAKLEEQLRKPPPSGNNSSALGSYYLDQGNTYYGLGRSAEAIAAFEKSIATGGLSAYELFQVRGQLSVNYRNAGDILKAISLDELREKDALADPQGNKLLPNIYRSLIINLLFTGNIDRAEEAFKKLEASVRSMGMLNIPPVIKTNYQVTVEDTHARLMEARGFYREAELGYLKSAELNQTVLDNLSRWPGNRPPSEGYITSRDAAIAAAGINQARQGRFVEAEINVRRALMGQIQAFGRYGGNTPNMIGNLANVVMQQGRYRDAERLIRIQIQTYSDLGQTPDAATVIRSKSLLAHDLVLAQKWDEATSAYRDIEQSIASWDPKRATTVLQNSDRISILYLSGRVDEGIAAAKAVVDRKKATVGDDHFETALARGQLAIGYLAAQRGNEALPLFRQAVPILTSNAGKSDDSSSDVAAGDQQIKLVVENYIALLARLRDNPPPGLDPALESLKLVDVIRGQSVQRALAASNARAAARDPELAELVRHEQDLKRQISGLYQTINDALALPPEQRNAKSIQDMQANVRKLAAAHDSDWHNIERKFPQYANLIDPKPPTVEDIRKALKPDEAFLSFYLGASNSFVWAVPKSGAISFASAPLGADEMEKKVAKLREALEPKASSLDEIPPFDLTIAHDIYKLFLQPTEAAWKPAHNLIFVTNGALGLLPLGLLPTAPVTVKADPSQPMFAEYRDVPWLARSHAVTLVPSASAFTSLRSLSPSTKKREPIIGFGDPIFSKEQAQAIQVASNAPTATTRGVPLKRRNAPNTQGVDKAELALLPRLPDTADELKSITLALQADPSKVLHLGKDANTRSVKSADLSGYKVVAFATHGLVSGDLDGLNQPALALSAPDVADVDGDGLLTMEEILGLKLDADWVVLSACNTGAGSGAGAEAASGLGRAFFYAGTRAILVTNWSVHSESARELVTDIFRRQAADAKLTRGEALRQAEMALLDGPGFQDNGKTVFAYAHPLFWAPYSLIGDGGGS